MVRVAVLAVAAFYQTGSIPVRARESEKRVTFKQEPCRLTIELGGRAVCTYVYDDPVILRPFFENLKTADGIKVTRPNPPRREDRADHATMHPGLWLAFGDIAGRDFWRNKARVVHAGFVEGPRITRRGCLFTVRNRYMDGRTLVCIETCRIVFAISRGGYMILWDFTFKSEQAGFYFGDQEEMGLGIRLASSIAVDSGKGGRILDSLGRVNEKQIWGKEALWCDYSGPVDGRFAGVTIMADPGNVRRCRWHVRDYGLMVANPFGREVFKQGPRSRVEVRPGEDLRLCFGVFVHSAPGPESVRLEAAYKEYLRLRRTGNP